MEGFLDIAFEEGKEVGRGASSYTLWPFLSCCKSNQGLGAITLKLSNSCGLASLLCHLGDHEGEGAVLLSQFLVLLSQGTQGGHLMFKKNYCLV